MTDDTTPDAPTTTTGPACFTAALALLDLVDERGPVPPAGAVTP